MSLFFKLTVGKGLFLSLNSISGRLKKIILINRNNPLKSLKDLGFDLIYMGPVV